MPLTEVKTVLADDGEPISETARKLYSLAELKALDEANSDEIESGAFARALEKMAEYGYDWFNEEINEMLDSDGGPRALFAAVGITVPQKTETINVKVDGKFQYDEQRRPITKTVTRDDTIWESWDIEGGSFTLNRRAVVDAEKYLRALQWWLAGKDIRTLPELQWGGDDLVKRPLHASVRQQRKLDLRSRDARVIREQGLVIYTVDGNWRRSDTTLDLDYHYDEVSDQTKEDANELLSDLCHEVVAMMRDEAEYRTSEEYLLEEAEANDRRFDSSGHPA